MSSRVHHEATLSELLPLLEGAFEDVGWEADLKGEGKPFYLKCFWVHLYTFCLLYLQD